MYEIHCLYKYKLNKGTGMIVFCAWVSKGNILDTLNTKYVL